MIESVMVFTPVYRLEAETIAAIFALEWDGGISYLFQRDNPHLGYERLTGIRNHLHQYQQGREMFITSGVDALLVIESDIIPPPDTLKRLAFLDCDAAYGCYVSRHGEPVINILERYPQPARNTGEPLVERRAWQNAQRRGVIDCSGGGLGCVLIKRHVMEKIAFRLTDDRVHCDTHFTQDVYQAGYEMKADCNLHCGHVTEDGRVLWPNQLY